MKKHILLLLTCVAISANAQHITIPTPLIGCMNYSEAWTDDSSVDTQIGLYSFLSDGSQDFTAVSTTGKADIANAGGAYGAGKYVSYSIFGSYISYTLTFHVWTPQPPLGGDNNGSDSWSETKNISLPKNYKYVPRDLTYDYRTDKFYAVCQENYENSSTGYICQVDTATGEMTELGTLSRGIANVAADPQGRLFGIGNDGHLYQITLPSEATKEATLTDLGGTDYRPTSENQGATIDFRTGRYYWASNSYKISSGSLDEVYTQLIALVPNFSEGFKASEGFKTDTLFTFPRREQFSGLFVVSTHPDAPDMLDDIKFQPSTNGGLCAKVTFTAPVTTYAQETLSGEMTATLWIDGNETDTRTITAGTEYSFETTLAATGNHTAKVVLTRDGLTSLDNTVTTWFGLDTPAATDSVNLVTSEDLESATLTWSAVRTGANQGWIDPENVTYTITRLPDNTVIATGLKDTTFTDQLNRVMRHTRYSISCTSGTLTGKATKSAWTNVGTPNAIPFTCAFDSQDEFNEFFVIDNNHDGKDGFESSMWQWDDDYYAAFYYGYYDTTADDYLITPSLNLNPSRIYRLSFKTYGYQGMDNRLLIQLGSRPTVEKLTRTVSDWTSQSTMSTPIRKTVFFNIKQGDRYIAFHNVSEPYDHMSIDDIKLEDFSSAEVPDTLTGLSAVEVSRKVKLTMTLPTTNAMDEEVEGPLTLYIYKGTEMTPAFTASELTPGSEYEWTDDNSIEGLNSYRIAVANDFGSGLEVKISKDISLVAPDAPTNVNVAYINEGRDVKITWGTGRYDDTYQYYNVYRGDELIASNLSTSQYIDIDPSEDGTVELKATTYSVSAANAGGESDKTKSTIIMIGTPYSLPFSETWEYQTAKTSPWLQGSTSYCCWSAVSTGYNPYALGQDGPGMMNCDVDGESAQAGWATIQTPTIDFSGVSDATLTFYLYRDPQYNNYTYLEVYQIIEGGDTLRIGSRIYCNSTVKGWEKQVIDVSELAGAPRASLIFWGGVVGATNSIHLDNITITGTPTGINEVSGSRRFQKVSEGLNSYDLTGRPVSNAAHGLFIINGKKIIN